MKFLVNDLTFIDQATKIFEIKQGYLNRDKERTVRIRIQNQDAFITVKGASEMVNGIDSRYEWEKSIDLSDAISMMKLCEGVVEKTRYIVPYSDYTIEVDMFKNIDLIIAEVEFVDCDEIDMDVPDWFGKNVTGVVEYYNSNLGN